MTGTWDRVHSARWHFLCPYNVPFIDTGEWYLLPSISFCWMMGFRGLHLRFLCFSWSIGLHYCDDMSHIL